MIYLFYECEENDVANYADDTSPCYYRTDIPTVISELQTLQQLLIGLVIIISKPIHANVTYYFILEVLKLYLLMKHKYNLALQKLFLVLPLTQS